jgi:hypothetical protein
LRVATLVASASLIVACSASLAAPSAAGPASLAFDPPTAGVLVGGGEEDVQLLVADIPATQPLTAFAITLHYDPAVVTLTLLEGTMLRSTGRTSFCIVSYYADGRAVLTCSSTGAPPGPTGNGELAIIRIAASPSLQLTPSLGNGVLTSMSVDPAADTTLLDPVGAPIALAGVAHGFVVVQALEGDVNKDCVVDVGDVQATLARLGATSGSPLYDPQYDVDPQASDGDIDFQDLQFVSGRVGNTCADLPPIGSTPTPTPTPTFTPTPTSTPVPCYDFGDFLTMLDAYGSHGPPGQSPNWNPATDFNADNAVNFPDFLLILQYWGCA